MISRSTPGFVCRTHWQRLIFLQFSKKVFGKFTASEIRKIREMHLFALGIYRTLYMPYKRSDPAWTYIHIIIYMYIYIHMNSCGWELFVTARGQIQEIQGPEASMICIPNSKHLSPRNEKTPEILMNFAWRQVCLESLAQLLGGGTYPGFIASTTIAFNRVSMLPIYGNCVSCNSNSAQQKHAQTNYILSREFLAKSSA